MTARLNFGCGSIQPDGWVNVDKDLGVLADAELVVMDEGFLDWPWDAPPGVYLADARKGLPWLTGRFDVIVANHSLQQVGYHDLVPVLAELRRVCNPAGGVLRVIAPDVIRVLRANYGNPPRWLADLIPDETAATFDGKLSCWATWYGTNVTPLSPDFLYELLVRAGWSRVEQVAPRKTKSVHRSAAVELDDREPESFYMEAFP